MARPWIAVREAAAYLARAAKLLSPEEQDDVVQTIARAPTCGGLIEGTGGLRELRIGASGRGKRGGARVVYYFHSGIMPAYLLALFAKKEKADLTPAERRALARLVDVLKRSHGVTT